MGGQVTDVASCGKNSTLICLNAWNTGSSGSISRRRANPSHAERQLINFMDREKQTDSSFLRHITKLSVHLDKSPCTACSTALVGLLREIREAQGVARTGPWRNSPATLNWNYRYDKTIQRTRWDNLYDLQQIGWRLMSPRDARPLVYGYVADLVNIEDTTRIL